jgi:hypothetical protein
MEGHGSAMKSCVSHNGSKRISNHIMGCNLFPTIGTMKKWVLAKYKDWPQMQWVILRTNEWGKPNLVRKTKEKT